MTPEEKVSPVEATSAEEAQAAAGAVRPAGGGWGLPGSGDPWR